MVSSNALMKVSDAVAFKMAGGKSSSSKSACRRQWQWSLGLLVELLQAGQTCLLTSADMQQMQQAGSRAELTQTLADACSALLAAAVAKVQEHMCLNPAAVGVAAAAAATTACATTQGSMLAAARAATAAAVRSAASAAATTAGATRQRPRGAAAGKAQATEEAAKGASEDK
jgi:hypothetical protein